MIFNAALVLASVIAASVLPADGRSVTIFLGLAVAYLVLAGVFALISGKLGASSFDRGTESAKQPAPIVQSV
jgi:hypothetical protein